MAEITNGRREIFLDGLKGTLGNNVKEVSPTVPPEVQVTPAIPLEVQVNPGFGHILQPVWYPGPPPAKSLVRRSIKGPENEPSSQLVLRQKRITSGDQEFDISSSFEGL